MRDKEHDRNEAAYRRLEQSINHSYAHGHFVAIAGGAVVGDADDFMTLHRALAAAGKDPRKVLIVQAGHAYPTHVIFSVQREFRLEAVIQFAKHAGRESTDLFPEAFLTHQR